MRTAMFPLTPRDLVYAHRAAQRPGTRYAIRIVYAARRERVPLAWAFALVEQESSFRNVFGHDRGSIMHGWHVTRARVKRLLRHIDAGGIPNGVGLTQLTWPPYVHDAERAGGAHRPIIQLRVGFAVLRAVTGGDYAHNAWKYNGARDYQIDIALKHARWNRVLFPRKTKAGSR